MLKPASPPGCPQPIIRSSISHGSSAGTLSSAARTIWAARSSGRISTSEPLPARPIGERAVETMTASVMTAPKIGWTEKLECNLAGGHHDGCGDPSRPAPPPAHVAHPTEPRAEIRRPRFQRVVRDLVTDELSQRFTERGQQLTGRQRVSGAGRVEHVMTEQHFRHLAKIRCQ